MDKSKSYTQYVRERFPILGAFLYGGGIFYSYFYFQAFITGSYPQFLSSLPGFLVVFLSLFQLRLLDDIKDCEHDRQLYPERMLSRGMIQTRDLKNILLLVVFLEISLSCFYGWRQLCFWFVLFFWSMLMYREFFVASWLNLRKGLYLASHQIIIPLLGFYAANIAEQISFRSFSLLIFSISVLSLTVTYELSRKTNPVDEESYTGIWGVKKTVFSTLAVAGTGAVILLYLYTLAQVHWFFRVMVPAVFLLFAIIELSFFFNPCGNHVKLLKIGGALYMLILFSLIIMAYQ